MQLYRIVSHNNCYHEYADWLCYLYFFCVFFIIKFLPSNKNIQISMIWFDSISLCNNLNYFSSPLSRNGLRFIENVKHVECPENKERKYWNAINKMHSKCIVMFQRDLVISFQFYSRFNTNQRTLSFFTSVA